MTECSSCDGLAVGLVILLATLIYESEFGVGCTGPRENDGGGCRGSVHHPATPR